MDIITRKGDNMGNYYPMVEAFIAEGFSKEESQELFETAIETNPFLALTMIPDIATEATKPEDDPLFMAFLTIAESTNFDEKLFARAVVCEDLKQTAKDVADKVKGGLNTAKRAVQDKVADIKNDPKRALMDRPANQTKHKIMSILAPIQGTYNKLREMNEEDKREAAISGSLLHKLTRIFFKVLAYTKAYPILFALMPGGFIFWLIKIFLFQKSIKDVWGELNGEEIAMAKRRLVHELELELKMVREKIEDARSAGDRMAKYKLMRVENMIEKEIERIKYNQAV
jgi:hypothetical protein